MNDVVIVAVISLIGTLIGSYSGVRKNTDVLDVKITDLKEQVGLKIDNLKTQVEKHNSIIERTFKLEEKMSLSEEKIKVANHRIEDLEKEKIKHDKDSK